MVQAKLSRYFNLSNVHGRMTRLLGSSAPWSPPVPACASYIAFGFISRADADLSLLIDRGAVSGLGLTLPESRHVIEWRRQRTLYLVRSQSQKGGGDAAAFPEM